jgi:hypothetical protein
VVAVIITPVIITPVIVAAVIIAMIAAARRAYEVGTRPTTVVVAVRLIITAVVSDPDALVKADTGNRARSEQR